MVGFGQVEDASGDQIGAARDAGFFGIDCDDDHHDAVACERAAIAQDRFADIADTRAVDEHVAAIRLADLVAVLFGEFEHVAVFDDEHIAEFNAGLRCETAVLHEHAILAVHRHEIFRAHEIEHEQQLLLRGMAGNVRAAVGSVNHDRAEFVEIVDRLVHRFFVARESASRK